MAQFIYYRDGDEEKGPFDEAAILQMYNGALFTSDVSFQIRSSEKDNAAPFIDLRNLISKNGPANPFRDDFADIDNRIEKAEKELAELRKIASKKSELEKKMAEMEKKLEEHNNENENDPKSKDPAPTKPAVKKAETSKKQTTNANPFPNIPGVKIEKFSMENDLHGYVYRKGLIEQVWPHPLCMCISCMRMFANFKQCLMHSNLSSCYDCIPNKLMKPFEPDFARWKKEDADRLSMGRRLFSRLTFEEKGRARPQTDFIKDINMKLKKEMVMMQTDAGREKTHAFLKSDAAKKIKDRLEKHLREAEGLKLKLVCNKCEVVCKNNIHFLIHLSTYDHQLKVTGTTFELVSLLLGWFNRDLYVGKADESETDESIDPDEASIRMMDAMRISGIPLVGGSFN